MGRIIVVTGANSGIGKKAAHRLAGEGHTVVMACRSVERAEEARRAIVEETGNEQVDVMELDTSSVDSIRSFAGRFRERYPRLDTLIHNAAYFNHGEAYRLGPDGTEITFATNVVGPYLLTRLLLESLKASADPRVLNAGSNIIKHFFDPKMQLDFGTLRGLPVGVEEPSVYRRYCRSKMALLMLTFALARELESDGIAVNYLHINGARMSKQTIAKFSLKFRVIARVQNLFLRSVAYMANNYVELAAGERFRGVTGVCFNDRLEAMAPGNSETARGLDQLRFGLGRGHYPWRADDRGLQERVRSICEELSAGAPTAA